MLIYSHDTFGLGHLRRCLKISAALKSRFQKLDITLVSGSRESHRFQYPSGVTCVNLDPVMKVGPEKYVSREAGESFEVVLQRRTELLLATVERVRPHIFLVDHAPLGMKRELLPALYWHRKHMPEAVRILGLRDIIDHPDQVTELWNEQGIYDKIGELYDQIAVYGSPAVFDAVTAYEFPQQLQRMTTYTGYIGDVRKTRTTVLDQAKSTSRPLVLVSIGGGDGAGEEVIGRYLTMLKQFLSQVWFDSIVITGPFMPTDMQSKFQKMAQGLPVVMKNFVSDPGTLFEQADLVVSTGGYNTIMEILSLARRGLIIPRVMYRREQLMRAEQLSELGLLSYLNPESVTPARLFTAVSRLLSNDSDPLGDARRANKIDLSGKEKLGDLIAVAMATQKGSPEVVND